MSPTPKQIKVVENMSENVSTKKELLARAGYSESMQAKPSVVLAGKGIQDLVAKGEAMGLDDTLCLETVKKAMQGRQLAVALQAVKHWWSIKYPESKEGNVNVQVNTIQSPEYYLPKAISFVESMGYKVIKEEE